MRASRNNESRNVASLCPSPLRERGCRGRASGAATSARCQWINKIEQMGIAYLETMIVGGVPVTVVVVSAAVVVVVTVIVIVCHMSVGQLQIQCCPQRTEAVAVAVAASGVTVTVKNPSPSMASPALGESRFCKV